MLVSFRKQFVYTKTVKTASTSVEVYFEKYCLPEAEEENWKPTHERDEYVGETGIIGYRVGDRAPNFSPKKWSNHMSAVQIKQQLDSMDPQIWDNYLKFCVVRNPFEKVLSMFYFLEKMEDPTIKPPKPKSSVARWFSGWRDRKGEELFRAWVMQEDFGILIDRDKYMIDNQVCMDYLIKYEELSEGIQHICKTIGVPFEPKNLPHLKSGYRPTEGVRSFV